MDENVGKPYNFPVTKFVGRKKTVYGQKHETFFCSELIAKAFKDCHIMQNVEDASHRFLPRDFSEKDCTIPFEETIHAHPEKTLLLTDIDEKTTVTIKSESEVAFFT